jgi:hypothetical protein
MWVNSFFHKANVAAAFDARDSKKNDDPTQQNLNEGQISRFHTKAG